MSQCKTAPHHPAPAICQVELSLRRGLGESWLPAFMLRTAALLALLAVLLGIGQAGAADWAKNFSGFAGASTRIVATARDTAGNVYVAGYHGDSTLALGSVTLTRIGVQDAFVAKLDAAGTVVWAKGYGGSGSTVYAYAIAVDAAGNVYLGGKFQGAALTTPALALIGSGDAFAIKLDAAGATLWAKSFGGSGAQATGSAITVDGAGNVVLHGSFQVASLTSPALTKIGVQDVFAVKLDSAGATVWAKNFGGAGASSVGTAVALDGAGNVYLGGYFPAPGMTTPALTTLGAQDGFVFKLAADGTTLWTKNFGGSGAFAFVQGIALGAGGEVYVGGYFQAASLTTPALTRIGAWDAFALKLDAGGATVWAKNFGGSSARVATSGIAVDGSGNVLLGGYFLMASLTTPALTMVGTRDAFAIKLDADGASLWAKNFGGGGAQMTDAAIAADGSDNVFLGGYFQNANLTSPALAKTGSIDAFALKLDAGGATTWAKGFGGVVAGGNAYVTASAVDAAGNTYVAGYFDGVTYPLGSVTLTRIGSQDAFAAKLDTSGAVVWAKNFGGSGASAFARGIALAASGSVVVSGYFSSADLTTPALTRIGSVDTFAVKLDGSGATVWAKNFGGSGATAYGNAVAVDGSGNVLVGGYFLSADLTTPALTRIGLQDAFAIKLDGAGTSVWARRFGGSGARATGAAIAADSSGNVYLGGYSSNADLTTPALTRIGSDDAFAIKLDSGGATVWSRNYGGSGAVAQILSMTLDGSGNPVLGGMLGSGNLTTPALTRIGINDAFALKLDSGGTPVWAKNFGSSGARAYGNAIAADSSGNVYLGGFFYTASLTSPVLPLLGVNDAFALKLDSSGALAWSKNYGGSGSSAQAKAIAADSAGNVVVGGYFENASLTTPALTLGGSKDALLIRVATVAASSPASSPSSGDSSSPSVISTSRNVETTLSGTTPVEAVPGSILTVAADAAVAGAKITLQTGSGSEPVSLKMGKTTFTLSPQGGVATLTLKLVRVNGKDTLVLTIDSGSVTLTAPAGQPVMALAGSVVSAGADGASLTSDGAKLAVTGGSITMSGDTNSFADNLTLTVYAGEVAEKSAAGKITLRVGSLSGADGWVGDPLKVSADPRRRMPVALNLSGKLGRLGDQTPREAIATAFGQASLVQSADGTLGPGIAAVPVSIGVDASRSDGVTRGSVTEVVKNGVVFRLAPTVNDFAAFLDHIDAIGGTCGAWLTMAGDGLLNLVSKGRQYAARAGLNLDATGGADGFSMDGMGNLIWTRQGRAQPLYPAFHIVEKLRAELLALDPKASLSDNGDGNYAIRLNGQGYILRPEYRLLNLFDFPSAHAKDGWWLDGGRIYLNFGNVTAQGMSVTETLTKSLSSP